MQIIAAQIQKSLTALTTMAKNPEYANHRCKDTKRSKLQTCTQLTETAGHQDQMMTLLLGQIQLSYFLGAAINNTGAHLNEGS